jgi:hypothetical protein
VLQKGKRRRGPGSVADVPMRDEKTMPWTRICCWRRKQGRKQCRGVKMKKGGKEVNAFAQEYSVVQ